MGAACGGFFMVLGIIEKSPEGGAWPKPSDIPIPKSDTIFPNPAKPFATICYPAYPRPSGLSV